MLAYPTATAGLALLFALGGVSLLAPALVPYDPDTLDPLGRLQEPSNSHWFGTDALGRDVFSLTLVGGRVSLLVSVFVSAISAICGTAIGISAGYLRRLDLPLMALMDGLMAFPGLLLAIVLVAMEGPHLWTVVLVLATVQTPRTARLMRSAVLTIRASPHVEAAEALGAGQLRIMLRHILPNTLAPLIVQATASFANAVLSEAALSFLGAGIPSTTPTWGNIVGNGRALFQQAPWLTMFPGLAIVLTVLSISVVGDALRDIFDPTLRRRA